MKKSLPKNERIKAFTSATRWEAWLDKNYSKSDGIWLRIFKKDSGRKTVTYAEALDCALCHGWIDGLRKSHDEISYIQKFTPRRPRSMWSKINTGHVERLIQQGRMKAAGHSVIEAAKKDGRWQAAYDSAKNLTEPEDFLQALARDPKAKAFFATLNRTNRYSILWRLQTARTPEIRSRRMNVILEMLVRGETFHAQAAPAVKS